MFPAVEEFVSGWRRPEDTKKGEVGCVEGWEGGGCGGVDG